MTLRTFSYGGGWQSTAALVLAAQARQARQELRAAGQARVDALRAVSSEQEVATPALDALATLLARYDNNLDLLDLLDFPVFLFCNVGADSENPDTLAYVEQVAKPYAAAHGIDLVELQLVRRTGNVETLLEYVERSASSIYIPLRLGTSGAPGRRKCTTVFKVQQIHKYLKAHGASAQSPAVVGLGISVDEYYRAHRNEDEPFERRTYPLIDLRLTRQDCGNIIARAGLPLPPKSACWFCPFHTRAQWHTLRAERPDLFDKAVALEALLCARNEQRGRGAAYLTGAGRPLAQVIGEQARMFDDDDEGGCESGFCFV